MKLSFPSFIPLTHHLVLNIKLNVIIHQIITRPARSVHEHCIFFHPVSCSTMVLVCPGISTVQSLAPTEPVSHLEHATIVYYSIVGRTCYDCVLFHSR